MLEYPNKPIDEIRTLLLLLMFFLFQFQTVCLSSWQQKMALSALMAGKLLGGLVGGLFSDTYLKIILNIISFQVRRLFADM